MREYITKLVKLLDYPSSNNVNMVGYRRLKRAWSYTDNKQHAWPLQYTNGTQHVWSQHTNTCRPAKMDLFVPPPNSTHIPCHSAILYPQHIDSTSVCCITFIRSKSDCFLIPRFYIFIMCNQCSHRVFVSGLFKLSAFRVCKAFFFLRRFKIVGRNNPINKVSYTSIFACKMQNNHMLFDVQICSRISTQKDLLTFEVTCIPYPWKWNNTVSETVSPPPSPPFVKSLSL